MNIDPAKFENPLQIGGIRTGSLDYPNPNGGQSCRVAHFNTGCGLRFTIALDRGGDIVEASYNETNLAYLTPNDYKPPNPAYHQGLDWLVGWPGGLLTTAGPGNIGEPRTEEGRHISLHGHYSNTPASVLEVVNPDPARGRLDMRLTMLIHDSRMLGPCIEVRREISCRLGEATIVIRDEVVNRGDERTPHALLYHVNFGYPLLDQGARLVYRGSGKVFDLRGEDDSPLTAEQIKTVSPPDASYRGSREQVVIAEVVPDEEGIAHVGVINDNRSVGVELSYPTRSLPRLANWLHYGPQGSYITALEPFYGSIFGKANDDHPSADGSLAPGESKQYELTIAIRTTPDKLEALARHDGPLVL